ncbi:hypothetical protein CRG98_019619 [Punica granatum]|uniref:Uncharacterized protein n=1 Tax=Punica granatum TaxID=22663 RepID=A0A2I0JUJ4_PUNGR|nr:hypothetical protein CRG98_019619 [Punica granatum]
MWDMKFGQVWIGLDGGRRKTVEFSGIFGLGRAEGKLDDFWKVLKFERAWRGFPRCSLNVLRCSGIVMVSVFRGRAPKARRETFVATETSLGRPSQIPEVPQCQLRRFRDSLFVCSSDGSSPPFLVDQTFPPQSMTLCLPTCLQFPDGE